MPQKECYRNLEGNPLDVRIAERAPNREQGYIQEQARVENFEYEYGRSPLLQGILYGNQ